MQTIGLVGAGDLGRVLAKRLTETGYRVRIANSRGPRTLEAVALETGAEPVEAAAVGAGADALILAVPYGQIPNLPAAGFAVLPVASPVIDAGNYVPPRDGAMGPIDAGAAESEWVEATIGRRVVKAFNSITDYSLAHNGRPKGDRARIAVPVSGGDPAMREGVMKLVERLGFTAWNAGGLDESWRQQIGQPAYCTDPTLAELPGLLAKADHASVLKNREGSMRIMAKMPKDFPKPDLTRVARLMAGLDRTSLPAWGSALRLGGAMLFSRGASAR